MKKMIGILTGATGGIGKEYVKALSREKIDEIWCIARNEEKLSMLSQEYGTMIRTFPMDLSKADSIEKIAFVLKEECPDVKYLINNAGMARMGRYDELGAEETKRYIDLNVRAVVMLTQMVLPFMSRGSHIINMSSQSSFQPLPYINLYASGKAFVRSYSRSLNQELKGTGITVTACCPGWVDTELLPKEYNCIEVKYSGLVKPAPVVAKAMKDAKRGKDMSVYSLYVKMQHVMAKLLPQKTIMKYWLVSKRKYLKR